MSGKIHDFFAALKECVMSESLRDKAQSLDEFIAKFKLETCYTIGKMRDEPINDFFKDDLQARDEMINLRNKCFWGEKNCRDPVAVASRVNDVGAPVTVSGCNNYYYCGRDTLSGSSGLCGAKVGPQCWSCAHLWAFAPAPAQRQEDRIGPFWEATRELGHLV